MRASHRMMLGIVVARLVFGMVFLASAVAHWRVYWYFPVERRWSFANRVTGLAMDWYGRSLLALAAGTAVGAGIYALTALPPAARVLGRRGVVAGIAHLGALMLLNDVLFYVFSLATRHVTPAPLPGWYCPR